MEQNNETVHKIELPIIRTCPLWVIFISYFVWAGLLVHGVSMGLYWQALPAIFGFVVTFYAIQLEKLVKGTIIELLITRTILSRLYKVSEAEIEKEIAEKNGTIQ